MTQISWRSIQSKIIEISWALFFISLPITSFPFFPGDVGGRTLVRPLAIYPMLVLLIAVTIPRLLKSRLPRTFLPLIAFVLIALIGSVFAFHSDLEAFRGVTPISRLIRNLITLGIGVGFYFTATLLHSKWDDLAKSLKWLYFGMGTALFWGTMQIPIVLFNPRSYFKIINTIQSYISTRKLFSTRISGLTFEPKWFAEQIYFLLLPWLIASVLSNRSIFHWRWKRITVEWLLLIWAMIVLLFTFSRSGIFILAFLVAVAFILYRSHHLSKTISKRKSLRRRILEFSTLIVIMVIGIGVIGSQNPYFSRLWRYWTEAKSRNRTYLEFIAVEQRLVYWETAIRVFETDPWLGVGLGNYAFYFDDALPKHPFHMQREIVRQITPVEGRDRLITPKNLPARLLAETGILGIAAFLAFLLAVVGCAIYLWNSYTEQQQFYGLAAFLILIVFTFTLFSSDSFAQPNMWIGFGLITAAAHLEDPLNDEIKTIPG